MTVPRVSRAQRYFFPSVTDFLFVGLLLTRLRPTLFSDGDTGWHLWAGEATLENGLGPISDALSFTREGALWENVEWVGEVMFALLYRHGAYLGVGILCTVVFAATFSWMYRSLFQETGNAPAALLVTVLAAQLTLIQFLARPLIFSFPLFFALLYLLRRPPDRKSLILIPLITLIWANVHPSAYLAPAMVVYTWLRTPRKRILGVTAVLAGAALGATPWGYAWIFEMIAANRSYFGWVEEWGSPQFGQLRFLPYLLYLLLALVSRRYGSRLTTWEAIWGLGWMVAVLVSARLGPYAAMAWAPFLARDLAGARWASSDFVLARLWRGLGVGLSPMESLLRPRLWPVLVGSAALILAPRLADTYPEVARGFPDETFPRAALVEADRRDLGPRVLNLYAWGGFISWESNGRWKTFIDGRAGFFGDRLLDDYLSLMTLGPGWGEVLERHQPDWILVPSGSPIVVTAPMGGRWNLVYQDSTAAILVPGIARSEIEVR